MVRFPTPIMSKFPKGLAPKNIKQQDQDNAGAAVLKRKKHASKKYDQFSLNDNSCFCHDCQIL